MPTAPAKSSAAAAPTVDGSKLSCREFALELLRTGDLDPVYILLWNGDLTRSDLERWLLAYFCWYHVGTSSWAIDGLSGNGSDTEYWKRMAMAAGSSDYPRGRERRHYRGAFSVKSVAWLQSRGVASLLEPITGLEHGSNMPIGEAIKYVKTWYGFGDWIAFKVADMIERLGLGHIDFSDSARFLFDSPKHGALKLWNYYHPGLPSSIERDKDLLPWALGKVVDDLRGQRAPPRYERSVNFQEAETVLCKWDAYINGHYHVGEDIAACRKGLLRFSRCSMSQKLIVGGRKGGLWS